jgi:hypothetical protein
MIKSQLGTDEVRAIMAFHVEEVPWEGKGGWIMGKPSLCVKMKSISTSAWSMQNASHGKFSF